MCIQKKNQLTYLGAVLTFFKKIMLLTKIQTQFANILQEQVNNKKV